MRVVKESLQVPNYTPKHSDSEDMVRSTVTMWNIARFHDRLRGGYLLPNVKEEESNDTEEEGSTDIKRKAGLNDSSTEEDFYNVEDKKDKAYSNDNTSEYYNEYRNDIDDSDEDYYDVQNGSKDMDKDYYNIYDLYSYEMEDDE